MLKKRISSYAPVFILALLIFFTVDIATTIRKHIVENFGDSFYNFIYIILFAVILVVAIKIIKQKKQFLIRLISLILISIVYLFVLKNLKYSVEKIHYLEYGLLSVLGFNAFSKDFGKGVSLFFSIVLGLYVGLADEFIQYLNPNRVGEIGDVLINVKASSLGLALVLIFNNFAKKDFFLNRKEIRVAVISVMLSVISIFVFMEIVHGYGTTLTCNSKVSFISYFSKEELKELDSKLNNSREISKKEEKIYFNEAERHKFQRDFYFKNKFYYAKDKFYIDYGKSFNENLILKQFYTHYLIIKKNRWDSVQYEFVKKGSLSFSDRTWRSRVKGTAILSFSKFLVRLLFFGVFLSLIVLFISLFFPLNPPKGDLT